MTSWNKKISQYRFQNNKNQRVATFRCLLFRFGKTTFNQNWYNIPDSNVVVVSMNYFLKLYTFIYIYLE